ncbi:Aminomethyltransferase [Sinobacterium norvegicum]|uniref:aminomethyltransferase n=1 Tax=Sinobacterium norvegicum TaxID=1641715 RepID=A0ABN8EDU7_9GAMM|nr:glycine cleavage system aminomethyltransferase GcvT [Sinobacterium norvegicum]CAH0990154.1 Aminomethyltransferase [Sinobacterium norvegicum]
MSDECLNTPLSQLHIELGAKMVPFAGYNMPVQYPLGVKKEHLHTRQQAGLFDVSHMGQIKLTGSGAAAALETIVPVDIIGLKPGQQRYAFFTNEQGGILDDLMVCAVNDGLLVVVNAACKHQDLALITAAMPDSVKVDVVDRALIALQGPKAVEVLSRFNPAISDMVFMDGGYFELMGEQCFVTRSGYTGEDGCEISVSNELIVAFAKALLAEEEVEAIGLGARDSLRLEAGLCLYGHDLNAETTPVEGALLWGISKNRRKDGERAGGFPGANVIFSQIEQGVTRKRVGLLPTGKAPIREGVELYDGHDVLIGKVTSGGFGASLGKAVAMGFVTFDNAAIGTEVFALLRGKKVPVIVSKTPFVPQRYYRG